MVTNSSITEQPMVPSGSRTDPLNLVERSDNIAVALIDRSPYQSRVVFDPDHIATLAASIKDHDLSSPILVRPKDDGRFELICGQHRCEAHKLLGRETIRAVIRCLSDSDAAIALAADNLQRSDLSDYEVYKTVTMLLDNKFARTDADVAAIIGRQRSYVTKVKAFSVLQGRALENVIKSPQLFGASMVAELKASGYANTHPQIVDEAFDRVLSGALTQAGVITFIRGRVKPASSSPLKDVTFKVKGKTVRMTVYQDTIRISCKGMDSLGIEDKLQKALTTLL
ncbi:MAG: ParB/RepB/Spo0J family partition protein [Propionivibrio sp.]